MKRMILSIFLALFAVAHCSVAAAQGLELDYSTYIGGDGNDYGYAITLDSGDQAYLTGHTSSIDFPIENPYQSNGAGSYDVFVTLLSSVGSSIVYSTYLGGGLEDKSYDIVIDGSRCAYIVGYTFSADFPTQNPYQANHAGGDDDAFIAKLSSTGSTILFSTYLGGSESDLASGIVIDSANSAYITGTTDSPNFPTQNPYQAAPSVGGDAFIAKLSSSGSSLIYSTYLGGSWSEEGGGIALSSDNSVFATGVTSSTDFPTWNPYQASLAGGVDAYAVQLSPSGSSLLYATYLGGNDYDFAQDIALDSNYYASISGYSNSTNFPTMNPYQSSQAGGSDVFVSRLSSTGSSLLYSTYLGGMNNDRGYGICFDPENRFSLIGWTDSNDFPTKNSYQSNLGGGTRDVFISRFVSSGASLIYSTYLGGYSQDCGYGICLDSGNQVYLTGDTSSDNFPTVNAYQMSREGGTRDAFVAKLNYISPTPTPFGYKTPSPTPTPTPTPEPTLTLTPTPEGYKTPSPTPSISPTPTPENLFCYLEVDYSTYLGGSNYDYGCAITVDSDNFAYVTGEADSSDFPVHNLYKSIKRANDDCFVTKLSSDGASIIFSNCLGGGAGDVGTSIVTDSAQCVYVTGDTDSDNFPLSNAYQPSFIKAEIFVAKFSSSGSTLLYSTYLGGSDYEHGYGISVDSAYCAYLSGETRSDDFPTLNPYQSSRAGAYDAFVTKLASSGSELVFSTYFGGPNADSCKGEIALDPVDCVYITGQSYWSGLPVKNPYQAGCAGNYDAFVTKFSSSGSSIEYSTYLGGGSLDVGKGLALDGEYCAYLIGYTTSTNFPTQNPYQSSARGDNEVFISKLSSSGSILLYSTYLGGESSDYGYDIAVDSYRCAYITGETNSSTFPVRSSYQSTKAEGERDAFVSKLSLSGSVLAYSTFLGGYDYDSGSGIDLDGSRCAYITGRTRSLDFPTLNSYQASKGGSSLSVINAFISKLELVCYLITPTPTPLGYHTPTPTVTPTPDGYKTPTPTLTPTTTPPPSPPPTATPTPFGLLIPFTETFEGSWINGAPVLWSREYISGTHNWVKASGGYDGNPSAAHGGAYNARFFRADFSQPKTRLISPRLIFGNLTSNTRLVFWHAMVKFGTEQDELSVYYRSAETDPWTSLASYDSSVPTWTQRTISLPNPSNDYYLCFEGTANYGYGVCIDDVLVTGESTDSSSPIIDSGDYNGDGTSDIAIFRGSNGMWSVRGVTRVYYGSSSDIPIPGDYNGDGATDIGIFRGSSGLWGVRGVTRVYYGSASDIPIPGDYNGDGSCDIGIFRSSSGLWAVTGLTRAYFGASGDLPVPGDYDGDGTKDIALFRGSSGLWAIRGLPRVYYGSSSDTVVPGDYNGDGTWEVGIFRPTTGMWGIRGVTRAYYGSASDRPVPADYSGDSTDDIGIFRGSSGLWGIRNISRAYFGASGDIPVTR